MGEHDCLVFEVARGTTHDGPGVRTTFFLKGCPLECAWCQNPEGIRPENEISLDGDSCRRCLACVAACPAGAVSAKGREPVLNRSLCTLCGRCAQACPPGAIELVARCRDMNSIVDEALKDREYYDAFGGGVTVSGGEPLRRPEFVREFFRRMRRSGVETALDTCGFAPREAFLSVLEETGHVLYDLKMMDDTLHLRYTGQSNRVVLENLLACGRAIRKSAPGPSRSRKAARLWIRTPLVPGMTATPANIVGIGGFLEEHLGDVVERWELCAFNNACAPKYRKLGLDWELGNAPLMRREETGALLEIASSSGFPAERIAVTGLVAGRE